MYTMKLSPFESTMLQGWEDVYKKSQLSLWILVAVREGKEYAEDIKHYIKHSADLDTGEQSLYRSLRRLESGTLLDSIKVNNPGGPDKKRFVLTPEGSHVLAAFIARNITHVYFAPERATLFTSVNKRVLALKRPARYSSTAKNTRVL